MKETAKKCFLTLLIFVLSGVFAFAEISTSQSPTVLTLELTVTYGKILLPKEKREISLARIDTGVDDKETRIVLAQQGGLYEQFSKRDCNRF